MKTRFITALASIILLAATVRGEETFDEAMKRAAADYGERLRKAADELSPDEDPIHNGTRVNHPAGGNRPWRGDVRRGDEARGGRLRRTTSEGCRRVEQRPQAHR